MESMNIDSNSKMTQIKAKYNWMTRMLWWCSGADIELLDECPEYDRAKYFGLGGIVAATGILASLSSGYAFYIVFESKKYAVTDDIDVWKLPIAIIIGLIWGAIIFNLERFIVASTGKGDGTENLTLKEFGQALPRIIMAVVISLAISKPLEIRIMKSEIDAELQTKQQEELLKLNTKTDSVLNRDLNGWEKKIAPLAFENDRQTATVEARRLEIKDQRAKLELEAEGKTGTGTPGRGPAYRDKKENLDKMEIELNQLDSEGKLKITARNEEISKYKKKISDIDADKEKKHILNISTVQNMAGLLERIKIGEEIGGWVSIIIWFFFLVIETGPVFFKMMISKSSYDYILENRKKLIEAERGIETKDDIFTDSTGKTIIVTKVTSHEGHKILAEKQELFDKQLELSKLIINKWKDQQKEAIEKNPSDFIDKK